MEFLLQFSSSSIALESQEYMVSKQNICTSVGSLKDTKNSDLVVQGFLKRFLGGSASTGFVCVCVSIFQKQYKS